jgi:hypothetical protein
MATDISNLYQSVFLAQDPPNRYIGGPASLEVAMMAVLQELAIIRPVSLNRAREPHLSQQELKDFSNALGQFLEALSNIYSYQNPPSHSSIYHLLIYSQDF